MESENKMSFEITGSDYKKLEAFRSDHEKCLQDMTGAQYEYSFIPTGIGTFITVTCSCGEKLLLSNETFGDFGVPSPKTSVAETMLKIVRNAEKRPALFLGEKSGKRLQTWLTGMSVYAYNTGHVEEAFFDKISKVAGKWREICTSENLNDEECFDAFYELFGEEENEL